MRFFPPLPLFGNLSSSSSRKTAFAGSFLTHVVSLFLPRLFFFFFLAFASFTVLKRAKGSNLTQHRLFALKQKKKKHVPPSSFRGASQLPRRKPDHHAAAAQADDEQAAAHDEAATLLQNDDVGPTLRHVDVLRVLHDLPRTLLVR